MSGRLAALLVTTLTVAGCTAQAVPATPWES